MPINKFVARKTDKTRLWGYRYLKFIKAAFFSQFFFFTSDYCFQGPFVYCV